MLHSLLCLIKFQQKNCVYDMVQIELRKQNCNNIFCKKSGSSNLIKLFKFWNLLNFACNVEQLIVYNLYNFKTFCTCYTVNQDVTVYVHGVLRWKNAVLILTRCVNKFQFVVLAVDSCAFGERCKTTFSIFILPQQ